MFAVTSLPNSSLYLTRHRAYDTALGRFVSADPSGLGGGPNLYAYCMGDPLAYIDPLGLAAASIGGLYSSMHSFLPSAVTQPIDMAMSVYANYNYYGGGFGGGPVRSRWRIVPRPGKRR